MKNEISLFESEFKTIWWIDQGNQKLKYRPQKYYKIPSLSFMEDLIFSSPQNRGNTSLIFCRYRREVYEWESKLISYGYHVLSCVGGGAREFSEKLQQSPDPDFIIATSVLSHGVNLPSLGKIFFTYQVKDLNFWIQMVARGGSKGDFYEVYSLERPFGLKWNIFFNFLAIQKLSLKIKWLKLYKQIEEWFLKAL
jgi:superfamily II DNA or RNA helicase